MAPTPYVLDGQGTDRSLSHTSGIVHCGGRLCFTALHGDDYARTHNHTVTFRFCQLFMSRECSNCVLVVRHGCPLALSLFV